MEGESSEELEDDADSELFDSDEEDINIKGKFKVCRIDCHSV